MATRKNAVDDRDILCMGVADDLALILPQHEPWQPQGNFETSMAVESSREVLL
jgi:hypothetical protein